MLVKTPVLIGFLRILSLLFSLSDLACAETLTRLEEIASRYVAMDDLLKDTRGIREYREALKAYMGESEKFDPIFEEFIKQIRDASANIPGFAARAWHLNSGWRTEAFAINGEFSGSGLEARRDSLANAVTKIQEEAKAQAGPNLTSGDAERVRSVIERLSADLKAEYGLLDKEALGKLSRREQTEYGAKLSGNKGLPKLADHAKMKQLAGYVTLQLMSRYERLYDALNSGDADVVANELKKLERASRFEAGITEVGVPVPKEILSYIEFHSPTCEKVVANYEKGIASLKKLGHMADPRLSQDLLARMQQLQGQGIAQEKMFSHLSPELQEKYRTWKKAQRDVNQRKQQFADAHGNENPFFFYELHEDSAKGTLRLKAQSGLKLEFIPSPRPFHAFFAGRKKGECVGGASCIGLTPRRWARASLEGAKTIFTERGDGKMEGYVGLTPVVHKMTGAKYEVVDIMSHSIKGDIVTKDANGRPVKYSFFDWLIDTYPRTPGTSGLVISDGNSVSMNVGAGEVVLRAPSYLENRVVGAPADFEPADPMAKNITTKYTGVSFSGSMIYDGMRNDGKKVVYLVPRDERRKWSKEELENELLEKILLKKEIEDRDSIWKLAAESGVSLGSAAQMRERIKSSEGPVLLDRLVRLGHNPDARIVAYLQHFELEKTNLAKGLTTTPPAQPNEHFVVAEYALINRDRPVHDFRKELNFLTPNDPKHPIRIAIENQKTLPDFFWKEFLYLLRTKHVFLAEYGYRRDWPPFVVDDVVRLIEEIYEKFPRARQNKQNGAISQLLRALQHVTLATSPRLWTFLAERWSQLNNYEHEAAFAWMKGRTAPQAFWKRIQENVQHYRKAQHPLSNRQNIAFHETCSFLLTQPRWPRDVWSMTEEMAERLMKRDFYPNSSAEYNFLLAILTENRNDLQRIPPPKLREYFIARKYPNSDALIESWPPWSESFYLSDAEKPSITPRNAWHLRLSDCLAFIRSFGSPSKTGE